MTPREPKRRTPTSSRRSGGVMLGTAALLALAATTTAEAADVGPLTRVTGQSPFSGCTADKVAQQSGVNYPNPEIEPWLAANPANPRNLVVGVQQDRWSNGGARQLRAL